MPTIQMGVSVPLETYLWIEKRAKRLNLKKGQTIRGILDEKRTQEPEP
jgi:hypothetical protein